MEIWVDIKDYEGLYQVSNLGRIKCLRRKEPIIMRPSADSNGYYRLKLTGRDGKFKSYKVHRLVAQAFIPNPHNLPQINHIDENPANNRMNNLEWCTNKYNCNYGKRTKRISDSQIRKKIPVKCIETGVEYKTLSEAARATGAMSGHIAEVCRGKRKTAGNYHWEFVFNIFKKS